jgi:hypothetical protein
VSYKLSNCVCFWGRSVYSYNLLDCKQNYFKGNGCLLAYFAMYFGRYRATFQRCLLPPFSVLTHRPDDGSSKHLSAIFNQTTRRTVTKDSHLHTLRHENLKSLLLLIAYITFNFPCIIYASKMHCFILEAILYNLLLTTGDFFRSLNLHYKSWKVLHVPLGLYITKSVFGFLGLNIQQMKA